MNEGKNQQKQNVLSSSSSFFLCFSSHSHFDILYCITPSCWCWWGKRKIQCNMNESVLFFSNFISVIAVYHEVMTIKRRDDFASLCCSCRSLVVESGLVALVGLQWMRIISWFHHTTRDERWMKGKKNFLLFFPLHPLPDVQQQWKLFIIFIINKTFVRWCCKIEKKRKKKKIKDVRGRNRNEFFYFNF